MDNDSNTKQILVSVDETDICELLKEEAAKPGFSLAYDVVALHAYRSGQLKSAIFVSYPFLYADIYLVDVAKTSIFRFSISRAQKSRSLFFSR